MCIRDRTKDIFFAKAQLVDHGDDAVVNTFLTVIAGIAGGCVCCVSGADPFHRSVPHLPMIESAALGTLNAACKWIFCLSHSFPELPAPALKQCLYSLKHSLW